MRSILVAAIICGLANSGWAQVPATVSSTTADLVNLELEALMNIEVTSVSRRTERLSDAAASIFVITREDIRRSGATSMPEALRLAPNLQVTRASSSGYAISARGFNNSAGNKLLVLIDGRSVYSPLFSGVFWDAQDVMLEDVERIEVISGPGGTLWGTNAVNGVINIVTRSAKDTQGALVTAGGGNRETDAALRYGGTIGADGHYRVYGKYLDRNHTSTANGSARDDAWRKSQVGFRADWSRSGDQVMVQGNAYDGSEGQPAPGAIVTGANFALGDIGISGVNLTTRWEHRLEGGSNLVLQAYYDRTERSVPPTFTDKLDTVDVQFQHSLQPAGIHALVWGAEYRYGMDRVVNSQFFAFLPANVNQTWASLFAQDEMKVAEDLRLTLGARIERNDYTGNEVLPSARLAWKFVTDHLLWTAASRAVRSPSRLDRDAFVPGNPPFLLAGGPNVRSEVAMVYEIGYRGQPVPQISYSVTAFRADYDHLRSQEVAPSNTSLFFANEMEGTTRGVEMWGTYQAARTWRLSGGAVYQDLDLQPKAGGRDLTGPSALGNDPNVQWLLRSSLDLTPKHELDVIVRHVGKLPNPSVPAYTAVDARLGWRASREVEFSLTLQNLFDPGHSEFGSSATRSELERGVFLKLLWRTL
jgi:iron complex outermembrane receptor protein